MDLKHTILQLSSGAIMVDNYMFSDVDDHTR